MSDLQVIVITNAEESVDNKVHNPFNVFASVNFPKGTSI